MIYEMEGIIKIIIICTFLVYSTVLCYFCVQYSVEQFYSIKVEKRWSRKLAVWLGIIRCLQ